MPRKKKIKEFRDGFMGYIHGNDPNYEPAMRFLLNHEHEVFEELTIQREVFEPLEQNKEAWRIVFNELSAALSPSQIQQLFEGLAKDFLMTGMRFVAMAESQKILQVDVGGETG